MAGQKSGVFQFLHTSHPDDTSSSWKATVRSHAAKNAVARQKRVRNYQNGRLKMDNRVVSPTCNVDTASSSSGEPGSCFRRLTSPLPHPSLAAADPFASFACPVTQSETFLLHHFVNNVVGKAFTCLPFRTLSDEAEFRRSMGALWMQMSIVDPGVLASILLSACRHLAEYYDDKYRPLIFEYKGRCISAMQKSLDRDGCRATDLTLVTTLALAADAIVHGEMDASWWHLRAARAMVASRGGIEAIEKNGFLGRLVIWVLKDPVQSNGALLAPPCLASVFI